MQEGDGLERVRRALRPDEVRRLRALAAEWEGRAARAGGAALPVGAVVVGVLWLATLLASDAPWPVVTGFWLLVGGALVVWVRRDLVREAAGVGEAAMAVRAAAEGGEVEDIRIRATALVELEEVEDEGACWGFQIGERRMVFVCGQEFYATSDFPSLDFSLVHALGADGRPVAAWLDVHGPRTNPDVTVPAGRKVTLVLPGHLEVREASVASVETDLGPAR